MSEREQCTGHEFYAVIEGSYFAPGELEQSLVSIARDGFSNRILRMAIQGASKYPKIFEKCKEEVADHCAETFDWANGFSEAIVSYRMERIRDELRRAS